MFVMQRGVCTSSKLSTGTIAVRTVYTGSFDIQQSKPMVQMNVINGLS
jgi:hypothetical protein